MGKEKIRKKRQTRESRIRKTTRNAIIIVILSTLLTSLGQLFYKVSFLKSNNILAQVIFSPYLYFGLLFYAFGALLLILALRHGELSTLYPFIALSFIWVSLLSFYLLRENFTLMKTFGIVSIIIGVVFIGLES